MAEAQIRVDIAAYDKSQAAFRSFNGSIRRSQAEMVAFQRGQRSAWTSFQTNINGAVQSFRRLRGVIALVIAGAGVQHWIDAVGRAVDKNLVKGADRMQSRWSSTWSSWWNTADKFLTEAAMGLDLLISDSQRFLGLAQAAAETVNAAAKGNFITPGAGATYGKGLPNNFTNAVKTGQAFQSVNTGAKDSVLGFKDVAAAARSTTKTFDDLKVSADSIWDEATPDMLAFTEAMRVAKDDAESFAEDLKSIKEDFKGAFTGFFASIAQGTNVIKSLRSELANLGDQLLRLAMNKSFDLLFGRPDGTGSAGILQSLIPTFASLPAFATGGTLGAGKWGIAGEAGPELIQGPATITPMGGGGGNVTVNNYGNVDVETRRGGNGDTEIILRNRMAREAADTNSPTSRVLTARGSKPQVKRR